MATKTLRSTRREVAGSIVRSFITWARRAAGEDAARRVAATIGRLPDEIVASDWFSAEETIAIALAAATETRDDDIGRRAGESLFIEIVDSGMSDFFAATGSPGAAVELLAGYGDRSSTSRRFATVDMQPESATVEATYTDLADAHPIFCRYVVGIYGELPTLFGCFGTAIESQCQLDGAPHCRFEIRWQQDPRTVAPDLDVANARADLTLDRLERLRAMAAELARCDTTPEALDRITEQAGSAVGAPRFLLAVTLDDYAPQSVHHIGFPDDVDVTGLTDSLTVGVDPDGGDVLLVPFASARRHYGHLAAVLPPGPTFTDVDRRLLEGYAAHAAASLDVIVALDDARRHRDTSGALLELARALTEVTTIDEMVSRLATAALPVLACTTSSIWLAQQDCWTLAARAGDGGSQRGVIVPAAVMLDLVTIAGGQASIMSIDDIPSEIRATIDAPAIDSVIVAPLVVRSELVGAAIAGIDQLRASLDRRELLHRVTAITDHAATVLDNARLLEQIHHDALHDSLTGLPNRVLVEERFGQALEEASAAAPVHLLFIDLDRFKNVNDTLGHHAGDDLICKVGERLASRLREDDLLGRLGGDEFIVMLRGVAPGDACATAQRLGAALRDPFHVDDRELFITCSIGVASAPTDGTSYNELLRHADVAMYNAKDLGRGTFAVNAAPRGVPRHTRLELESRLYHAVENDELAVVFQPQFDLATMEVLGAEALVRWDHPELGRLAPDRFLPLAEESGLIVEIDRWVRRASFDAVRGWQDDGLDIRIAVNLSTRELQTPDLADRLCAEVAAAGISPDDVEIEITDRIVIDEHQLPALLHPMRAAGFRLAIDDFGTGTSVLSRLRDCPIDTLKIDRSFTQEIGNAAGDTIVRALVSLGRSLDLCVVAEGIEHEAQQRMLRRLQCEVGQGYLLSRPVTAPEIAMRAMAHQRLTVA